MREMKDSGNQIIGLIPKDKTLLRNKYKITYTKGKNPKETNDKGEGTPYIGASDLEKKARDYETYTTDELPLCEPSDVLVLWDGARAGLMGTNHKGAIASTVVKLTPDKTYAKGFLYWYLKAFEPYLRDCVNGTTIPHMNTQYIEDIGYISWSNEEQEQIADYLDKKCAEIDEVIKSKEKTNELLKERRQSIIFEAVTKGLNPDAPMKDSGDSFVGMMPVDWNLNKIKYVCDFQPKCDSSLLTEESIVTYTPMENIKNGYYIPSEAEYGSLPSSLTQYMEGDIAMAKVTPCFENGNISIMEKLASGYGVGSSELFIFRPTNIDSKFLFYWLQHKKFVDYACGTMTGAGGLKRVSPDFVKNCHIALPSNETQEEIASYLDTETSKIDSIIKSNEASITKLKEYKDSLIYEAVTGKIEI